MSAVRRLPRRPVALAKRSVTVVKLEDLKRSHESDIKSQDILNNVKIGHGQPKLIILTYFVWHTSPKIHTKTKLAFGFQKNIF